MRTIFLLTGCFVYAFNSSIHATPSGWKGVPIITSIDGVPAICLPRSAETFPVYRIMVAESFMEGTAIWELDLEPNAKPVVMQPGGCLKFGESLDGYKLEGDLGGGLG